MLFKAADEAIHIRVANLLSGFGNGAVGALQQFSGRSDAAASDVLGNAAAKASPGKVVQCSPGDVENGAQLRDGESGLQVLTDVMVDAAGKALIIDADNAVEPNVVGAYFH